MATDEQDLRTDSLAAPLLPCQVSVEHALEVAAEMGRRCARLSAGTGILGELRAEAIVAGTGFFREGAGLEGADSLGVRYLERWFLEARNLLSF